MINYTIQFSPINNINKKQRTFYKKKKFKIKGVRIILKEKTFLKKLKKN